jgi:hypothetical protein
MSFHFLKSKKVIEPEKKQTISGFWGGFLAKNGTFYIKQKMQLRWNLLPPFFWSNKPTTQQGPKSQDAKPRVHPPLI